MPECGVVKVHADSEIVVVFECKIDAEVEEKQFKYLDKPAFEKLPGLIRHGIFLAPKRRRSEIEERIQSAGDKRWRFFSWNSSLRFKFKQQQNYDYLRKYGVSYVEAFNSNIACMGSFLIVFFPNGLSANQRLQIFAIASKPKIKATIS